MGFMDAVKSVFSNYANFQGRARRSEYWFFYLFCILVGFVSGIILGINETLGGLILALFCLGIIIPSLAVSVRRLHDTGKSGWFLLIGLIPIVGGIIVLIFMVSDSQPGANQYGANPKGA